VLAIGEARETLKEVFSRVTPVKEIASLEDAVRTASQDAAPGTTVLLSPGCASFDMFANFEERGRVFKQAVLDLGKAGTDRG